MVIWSVGQSVSQSVSQLASMSTYVAVYILEYMCFTHNIPQIGRIILLRMMIQDLALVTTHLPGDPYVQDSVCSVCVLSIRARVFTCACTCNYPGPLLNTEIGYPVHQGRDTLCLA